MNKSILPCVFFLVQFVLADYQEQHSAQEYVILRTSQVLAKEKVDSINIDLLYIQRYHDFLYDALCLALVFDSNKIVDARDISLLCELNLIDERYRIKDDVAMVCEARLLDHNIHNPLPYETALMHQVMILSRGAEIDR